MKGPDYGSADEVHDRAVETKDKVVFSRPPCGQHRVDIKGSHCVVRQIQPDNVSYFGE